MASDCCSEQKKSFYCSWLVPIYIIVNIRVEAGFATPPERIIDASVALYIFVLMLYIGAKFFNLFEAQDSPFSIISCGNRSRCGRR